MRVTTSIPRIYADERGLKHHELTEFENERKNPRKSASIGVEEVTGR
jgi:hypothetical protein